MRGTGGIRFAFPSMYVQVYPYIRMLVYDTRRPCYVMASGFPGIPDTGTLLAAVIRLSDTGHSIA